MFVHLIGLIILLNKHVLSEDYDKIRTEEETRHKQVLTDYLKAAISGALNNLFPTVTNREQIEAEKLIAECAPLLDPPLPETLEQLEAKVCATHRQRGKNILEYIRKRYPTHLITQITVRLGISSMGRTHDNICEDVESRNHFVKNAPIVNKHLLAINVARNKFIDNALTIVHTNATNKLALICCSYWSLKSGIINALPTPESKHYVSEKIANYDGDTCKYLCLYHSDDSQECANLVIPLPPTNVTRFTSVTLALIESIARLTRISA